MSAGSNITGNNNICIGAGVAGVTGESNVIRIGDNLPNAGASACYIGGIVSKISSGGNPVHINPITNQLFVTVSSERFQTNISPMAKLAKPSSR